MNEFLPNKILFSFLLLIVLGFGLFYFSKIQKSFYQLQYDWDKKEIIETFKINNIKNVSSNSLSISVDNSNFQLDNQFTYSLRTDQDYYFRFNSSIFSENSLDLYDLVWITDSPTNLNDVKSISKLNLPLKHKSSDKKIAMIGNQLIYINEAKYLRKEIKKYKDVHFIGNVKDIYNNSFINIDDNKLTLPNPVDYIIIFSYFYPDSFYNELNSILHNKNIKLIIIENPELINHHINNFNLKKLRKSITPIIIDPNIILNKNPTIFYYDNNKYLTLEAYNKIAYLISKELK